MNLDYVIKNRGLKFLKKGMRVKCCGQMGTITGGNSSGNINVKFDGEKHSSNCHPKHDITYFNDDGGIITSFGE